MHLFQWVDYSKKESQAYEDSGLQMKIVLFILVIDDFKFPNLII